MRKSIVAAGAIAAALLASGTAEACATVSFSPSTVSFTDWDPINPAQKVLTFNATIDPTPGSTRRVDFIFLDNESESPIKIGAAGPQYSVTSAGNHYAYPSETAIGTVMPFDNLPNANAFTRTFTVTVPANSGAQDYIGGVMFTEALKYSIECRNSGGALQGSASNQTGPTISLTIPKLVSITTASPQTINFGNFTTATQQLNVGLKSTSSVNVSVTTSNVNQMVLAGAVSPYPANSVILYTMTLNNDPIASGTTLTNRPRATVAGTNWPLILTLLGGVPNGKLAGSYSDTITLTLTPGI